MKINSSSKRAASPWAAILLLLTAQSLPLSARAQGVPLTSAAGNLTHTSSAATSGSLSKSLDFSSTQASIAATHSGTVLVGGQVGANGNITGATPFSVNQGQLLTPAMNAALWQSITSSQHLLLNSTGSAIGGSANVNSSWASNLSSLVVPTGVTVNAIGFNTNHPLNVAGSSNILGSVFALQTSAGNTAALNFGNNLNIAAGGLLSGNLPTNASGMNTAGLFASQNLNLSVAGNFSNSGTVSVPGNLNLDVGGTLSNLSAAGGATAMLAAQNINILSGSGSIVNSGLISATDSLKIGTANAATNLVIDNKGGVMQALNAINVRDALYSGAASTSLKGGDWLSQELNINGGHGEASVDVGELDGSLNVQACSAHISASTPNLTIGKLDVSGDPFIFNNGGDLDLNGLPVVPYLVATASGSIYTSGISTSIDTSSAVGDAGNIVLAAGVTAADAAGSAVLSRSGAGGDIYFVTGTTLGGHGAQNIQRVYATSDLVNGNGGNITMIAMSSSQGSSQGGHIFLPSFSDVYSGGAGSGSNGNITLLAEGNNPGTNSISAFALNTGSASGAPGNILTKVATPNLVGVSISETTGAITGSFDSNNYQNGQINIGYVAVAHQGNITMDGGSLNVANLSGNNINLSTTAGTNGNITIGQSLIASNSATIIADGTGSINTGTSVVATIPAGHNPRSVALSNAGDFAVIGNFNDNTISIINTSSNTIVGSPINVGNVPYGVALTPSGSYAYVTNLGSSNVSVVDTSTKTVVNTINVGANPTGVAINPAGTIAYIANYGGGTVSAINTSTNAVVATITVGTNPISVALNPTGTIAYVTNVGSNNVSVINTTNNSVITTIPVGHQPQAVAVSPAGTFAYVVNYADNSVSTINTATNTVVGSPISVGSNPTAISLNATGTVAYVSNTGTNDVWVINTATNQPTAAINVGSGPYAFGSFAGYVGNNETAYIPNGASNSVSVIRTATIIAPNLTLSSANGDINVSTAGATSVTANTGGNVSISAKDSLSIGTSNVGLIFSAGTASTLETTGAIRSGLNLPANATGTYLNFQSTLNGGSIAIGGNLTSFPDIALTTIGTNSSVLQTAGLISLPNGNLLLNTPQFGNISSSINVSSRQSISFNVPIVGNTVTVTTTDNNAGIKTSYDITSATVTNLTVNGSGTIRQTGGSFNSPSIFLSSGTGDIGTSSLSPLQTQTGNITANTGNPGSIFINNRGALVLGPSSGSAQLIIGSDNNISTSGSLSTGVLSLSTTSNNGSIILGSNVTATTSATLNVVGTGTIIQTAGTLTAPLLNLNAVIGNIGSGVSSPLNTVASTINANTGSPGSIFINNSGALSFRSSTASAQLNLSNDNNISINGPISSGILSIATLANNGNIKLNANVQGTTSASFSANGSGSVLSSSYELNTINVQASPTGAALNSAGTFAYVTNAGSNSVSVINTATKTVVSTIGVGPIPAGIAITPSGNFAYVANSASSFVSVINTASKTVVATIGVGSGPYGIAVNPLGTLAYVKNANSNTVSVINTATNTVVATVNVGSGIGTVAVNPAGTLAYVSNNSSNTVSVINTASNTVVATINVGSAPLGLAVNPNGNFLYVTNINSNNVSVIDTSTNSVVATVNTQGSAPIAIAVNPSGTLAYVSNRSSNNINVIDTALNTVVQTLPLPHLSAPWGLGNFVNFVGNNVEAYIPGNQSATVTVVSLPTIISPAVNLTSASGDINVATAGATALTTITSGNVTVSSKDAINIGASAVGGTFFVGSAAGLNTNAAITAGLVNFQSTLSNGNISIGGNLTGTIGITLSTIGPTGSVLQSGGLVSLPTGNLLLNTTQLGNNSSNVNISSAQSLNFTLPITGNSVTISTFANNGSISFNRNLNAISAASISANGSGNIAENAAVISAPSLLLQSGTGNIGTSSGSPLLTVSNNITASTGSPGSIFISNSGALTLGTSSGSSQFNLTNNNNITTSGIISTGTLTLATTANNGNISFGANAIATTAASLSTNGTGNIANLNSLITSINVGNGPTGVAINAAGTYAYIANEVSNTVSVVNTATNALVATIGVGNNPQGVALNPAGTLAYVANSSSNTVSVINTSTNAVVNTINVGSSPNQIVVTPSGSFAYVTNSSSNNVSVIDTSSNTVVSTISVGNNPQGIAVNRTGTTVYVANYGSNTLSEISTSTNSVNTYFNVGAKPLGVAVSPNSNFVYVANQQSNSLTVIDMQSRSTSTINSVGTSPRGVSVNPTGTSIYVTNDNSATLSIIDAVSQARVNVNVSGISHTMGNFLSFVDNNVTAYLPNYTTNNASVVQMSTLVTPTLTLNQSAGASASLAAIGPTYLTPTSSQNLTITTKNDLTVGGFTGSGVLSVGTLGSLITSGPINVPTMVFSSRDINIGASISGTTVKLLATGSSGISTSGAISASIVNFSTIDNNGNITLGANVTGTSTATIFAFGSGNIYQTAGVLSSPFLNLSSTTGNIGTSIASPLNTISGSIQVSNGTPGSVFISNKGATTISFTGIGNAQLYLTNDSNITSNYINTGILTLNTTANNGTITFNSDVIASTSASLSTNGFGTINFPTRLLGNLPLSNTIAAVPNAAGTRVYVSQPNSNTITVLNPFSQIATITVGANPLGIALNKTGTTAYVANSGSNNVSVINTSDNSVTSTISVGTTPFAVAVSPSGTLAYVSNASSNSVSVIDTTSNSVITTIPVGLSPAGITVSPNGSYAYVANQGSNSISVINTSSNSVIATINVGQTPRDIALNPAGTFAYVSNIGSNNVSVIDTRTNLVVGTVAVGSTPVGISIDPTGTFVYVNNLNSHSISVINSFSNTVVSNISLGTTQFPYGIGNSAFIFNNDVTALIPNQSGNMSVIQMPSISTPSLTVTSTAGDISIATAAPTGATSVIANTAGNFTIVSKDSLNLGNSTIGGNFIVGSTSSISTITNSVITANIVSLQSTLYNGNISLSGNLTGTNGITLTTTGPASAILQTAGTLSLPNGNFILNTSQFGDNNSNVRITSAQNLAINVPVFGTDIDIFTTANNSNITLTHDVTITGSGSLIIGAQGSGNVIQTGGVITTPRNLVLYSGTGSIGTSTSRINTSASYLQVITQTSGSGYISNSGAVTIDPTVNTGSLDLTNTDDITVFGFSTPSLTLSTTANNASVTFRNGMLASNSISVSTNGSGNIYQTGGVITSPSITMISGTGNIGNSILAPLHTQSSSITASTGTPGSIFISNMGAVNLGASSGSAQFSIKNDDNISTSGAISSNLLSLTSTANNCGITLGANLNGGTISLATNGTGNLTSNQAIAITATGAINIKANDISGLVAGSTINSSTSSVTIEPTANQSIGVNGGIGMLQISSTQLANISADTLIIGNATSTGNIDVSRSGGNWNAAYNLSFMNTTAGSGTFTNNGTLNVGVHSLTINTGGAVTLGSISTAGASIQVAGSSVNVNGAIGSATDQATITSSAGNIAGTGTITAQNLTLNVVGGSIGNDAINRLNVLASGVNVNATNGIFLNSSGPLNFAGSNATTSGDLDVLSAGTISSSANSSITASTGKVLLSSSGGGIALLGNVNAASGSISLTSNNSISNASFAALNAPSINLKSTGSNINLNSGLSAATSLTLDGSTGVTATGGNFSTASLVLKGGNGNIIVSNTDAGAVSFTTSGTVNIGDTTNVTYGVSTGSTVTLTSSGTITANGGITASGALGVNAASFNTTAGSTVSAASVSLNGPAAADLLIGNAGTINASTGAITATSAAGYNLNISGNGLMSAAAGSITLTATTLLPSTANIVTFTGGQTFTGPAVINATGAAQSVNVNPSVVVTGNNSLTINSPLLNNQGTITGNPLIYGTPSGGTIANSSGNIDLKNLANLQFSGFNLALLASGSIINTGAARTIDLSKANAAGGALTLIAGYNFSPSATPGLPQSNTNYILNGTTNSNSSISLANVSILTSATGAGKSAGSVTAVAGTGSIALGSITSTADAGSGKGGSVFLLANGINVGAINTSANISGSVVLNSATPAAIAPNSISVANGSIAGGTFNAGVFGGNILVNDLNAGNANITITTGGVGAITQSLSGTISTTGTLSLTSGSRDFSINAAAASVQLNTSSASATVVESVLGTLNTSTVVGNIIFRGVNGVAIGAGQTITAGGNLTVANTGLAANVSFGNNSSLSAGTLTAAGTAKLAIVPIVGLVAGDVQKAGAVSIQSSGLAGSGSSGIVFGNAVSITSNGGDISLNASKSGANINTGDLLSMNANGGSISVTASSGSANLGLSSGGTGMSITTRTIAASVGGNLSVNGNTGVRIGSAATVNLMGSLSLNSGTGTIDFAPAANVNAGTTSVLLSGNGINFGSNTIFNTGNTLSAIVTGATSYINMGNNVSITAGALNANAPLAPNAVLSAANIKSYGSISMTIIGSGGLIGSGADKIVAEGGGINISATAQGAAVSLGNLSSIRADGGTINIYSADAFALGAAGGTGGSIVTRLVGAAGGLVSITAAKGLTIGDNTQNFIAGAMNLTNQGTSSNNDLLIGAGSSTNIGATANITQVGPTAQLRINSNAIFKSTGVLAITATGNASGSTINVGNNVDVESSNGAMNISSVGTGTFNVGDGSIIKSLNGSVSIFSGGSVNLGNLAGAQISAGGGTLTLSSSNGVSTAQGTTLSSSAGMTIQNTGAAGLMNFGSNTQVTGGALTTIVNLGNTNFTTGSNVQINATGGLNLSQLGTGSFAFGAGTKLQVNNANLSLYTPNQISFGAGSQLTAVGATAGISVSAYTGINLGASSTITAGNTVSLNNIGAGKIQIGANNAITGGNISLSAYNAASDIEIGNSVSINAGALNTVPVPPATPAALSASDIKQAGSISITASGNVGGTGISIGTGSNLTSNGMDITLSSLNPSGQVAIGDSYAFTANGGSIRINSLATTANALSIGTSGGNTAGSTMTARPLGVSAGAITYSSSGNLLLGAGTTYSGSNTSISSSVGAASITGTVITSNQSATITGSTGITIDAGANVSALNSLTISTTGSTGLPTLTVGNVGGPTVNLKAGSLAANAPISGVLVPANVATTGGLVLSAASVKINDNNVLTSNGADLSVTANIGTMSIGSGNTFQANGGNVSFLAKGTVTGATGNTFYARAIGTSPSLSSGGGIEVGSGLIYGTINAAFTKAPGTNPADGALGTGVVFTGNQPGATGGVIQANQSLGGIINLNPGPNAASTLTLTKGVQVFDAQGAGSSVIIDNGTFKTEALKPIALVTAPEQDENALATLPLILKRTGSGSSTVAVGTHGAELAMHRLANGSSLIVAAEDASTVDGKQSAQILAKPNAQFTHSENGVIQLRKGELFLNASLPISVKTETIEMRAAKGALVGIRSMNGCTYVRVCSGLGTVSVLIDGKSISLSSGEEMVVSNHKLDQSEIHPFDGLGRRNSHSTAFGNKHITISDFSIMSMIANHDLLLAMNKSNTIADRHLMARMLKTAATVDVVLKYRGAYSK